MSLQNLLEMDDIHAPGKGPPKPKPRPFGRASRIPKLGSIPSSSSTGNKKERAIDDILSISSEAADGGPSTSQRSPKHGKRSVAFTTTTSFDNNAFVEDDDDQGSSPPRPMERQRKQSWFGGAEENTKESSSSSRDKHKAPTAPYGRNSDSDDDKLNDNVIQTIGDEDDDGNDSAATFTIENEVKYKDSTHMSKKPPIPKPKRRGDSSGLPPKPIPKKRSTSEEPYPSDDDTTSHRSAHSTDNRSPPLLSSSSPKRKNRREYSTVEIDDTPLETDGNNENGETAAAVGAEETASVSSAAAADAKQTVKKSRFGKLFKSSLSLESNKNKKKVISESSVDKSGESGSVVGGKEKGKFVSRWKKTFSKAKPAVQEEEHEKVDGDEEGDEVGGKAKPEVENRKYKKHAETKRESRVFMPQENSDEEKDKSDDEEEEEMEESLKSEHEAMTPTLEKKSKKGDRGKLVRTPEPEQGQDDNESELKPSTSSGVTKRFKPFAKLIVSKNKEGKANDSQVASSSAKKSKSEKKMEEIKEREMEVITSKSKMNTGSSRKASEERKKKDVDKRSHQLEEDEFSGADFSTSEDEDEQVTKPEVKKRRERVITVPEIVPCVDSASGKDLLLGVTVHSSDLLPLDPNVIHPVIKVTIMYQNGEFMRRSNTAGRGDDEVDKDAGEDEKRRSRKRRSRKKESDPQQQVATTNLADSVYPIMSQPCRARHSIPTFAPTWNELLVFEEPFKRLTTAATKFDEDTIEKLDPILFFEVMDFLPMTTNANGGGLSVTGFHGSDPGWYKVAWAFLKPIGANGIMNLNRKLRLQLYKPVKLRKKERFPGPEVFSWWKVGSGSRREKINCTLYVTPKGILPPETKSASLRQLLSMRKEQLTQATLDSQLAATRSSKKKRKSSKESLYNMRDYSQNNWTRMEGQSCKPPNKLVATLPSSQIASLNIVISGNVHCTKFSPCGNYLACGLDTDELHVILLFSVPGWTLLKSLKGHHGLVYDINWKIFEFGGGNDENSYHYLASASADSTVRIWKMQSGDEKTLRVVKVLHHPSYVYCVRFHPTHPSLVVTGCFDFVVRVWDVKPDHVTIDLEDGRGGKGKKRGKESIATNNNEASPIILLDKHGSFVNCLLFDTTGQHLFSGDGSACVFKWSCMSPSKKKSWRLEKDVKLHNGNVPVNCLNLHPSGSRLLVHLRDNFLKILDVVTLIPLQTFSGLHNERLQIGSCFSPCGNLVLSGSEDSTLCVWDADTGKILQLTAPQNHPNCVVTSVDYHPFDYYCAVGLASTISEPSPILVYFYQQSKSSKMSIPMLAKSAMRMRQSLERSRSQSQQQSFDTTTEDGAQRGPPRRGDSTEKFISIIQKLDTALYFAQQRNKKRQSEATSSTCLSSAGGNEERMESVGRGRRASTSKISTTVATADPVERTPSRHYSKKRQQERPRSASLAGGARTKRERFRGSGKSSEYQREAKSDSEQSYQLKVVSGKATEEPIQIVGSKSSPPKPLKRRSISVHQQESFIDGENNLFISEMP